MLLSFSFGKYTLKILPFPSLLSNSIYPLWISTNNVLEGPIEIADCIEGVACDNIDCCATRLLWTKIKSSIDEVMEGITLQDIVDDYNKIKEKNEALTLQRSE